MEQAGIIVVSVCVGIVLVVFCAAIVAAVFIGRAKRKRRQKKKGSLASSRSFNRHSVFDDGSSQTKAGTNRLMHAKKASFSSTASSPGLIGSNRHNIKPSSPIQGIPSNNSASLEDKFKQKDGLAMESHKVVNEANGSSCINTGNEMSSNENFNARNAKIITLNLETQVSESSDGISESVTMSGSDEEEDIVAGVILTNRNDSNDTHNPSDQE
jgi:hypothetical protein